MEIIIKETINSFKKPVFELLNGRCFSFAKALQDRAGGKLRYLLCEYHVVLDLNGKLYDASGNVTKQYKNSKYIEEDELMKRSSLVSELEKYKDGIV